MSKETLSQRLALSWVLVLALPGLAGAQVPVGQNGETLEATSAAEDAIPLLSATELESLVGSIALYPDDLLAIVLPASTYPLQLVQAERFLQDLKVDSELKPDDSWDDSIVALLNYPEAVQLLTKDLDKTWRLGEAVVAQQTDVIAAIERFRDQAYDAGNLKSDSRQNVVENEGVIEISPVEEDVIYVPYYEPEEVVVYQPRPVYYYYPRAYPLYYYPYSYGYNFSHGFFWGVTTAFTVGWFTDSLHVHHHSYYGHPYHGRYYGYNNWYRRPSIHVHNNYYYSNNNYVNNRHGHGDYWRPGPRSTVNYHDQRVTRNRHYPGSRSNGYSGNVSEQRRSRSAQRPAASSRQQSQPIAFRQRELTTSNQSSSVRPANVRSGQTRSTGKQQAKIEFQERSQQSAQQQRSNQLASTSKLQRSSRPERSAQPQRASRPERSAQPQRASRPERSAQPQRTSRPQRSAQGQRPGRADNVTKSSRSSQPKQQRTQRSGSNKVARSANNRNRGDSGRR